MAKQKISNKPDPVLVKDQLQSLQGLFSVWGPSAFMRYFVFIQTKKNSAVAMKTGQRLNSRIVPFVYNPIQEDIEKHIGQYNICLKPRQIGLTTWFLMRRIFVPSLITTGTNGFLISQSSEKATEHFAMLKRALQFVGCEDVATPEKNELNISLRKNLLHTTYSNRKEIIFDQLGNTMRIGSAEVEEAGQGSTLHHCVASEVARWPGNPEETLANLKEAIVLEGTLDLESTANGLGGYFYEEFIRASEGKSEFTSHFSKWWEQPEYRVEVNTEEAEEMLADLTADELRLIDAYKLDIQQIAFRRQKKLSLRHNFEEKYPEDPISCFLMQGKSFFNKDVLAARYHELLTEDPVLSIAGGSAKIFQKPLPGRRYVIGADPASGKTISSDNTDYSAAKVIDYDSAEEVCSYRTHVAPEDFALDLEYLGKYYNNALIAVERGTAADSGGNGGTVLTTLIGQGYGNIYQHREKIRRSDSQKEETTQPGLPMTSRIRPMALNKLKYMLDNEPELFHDIDLIKECLVFVRDEKGTPAASPGNHDDMVLASAIAQLVRDIDLGFRDVYVGRRESYGDTPSNVQEDEEKY